MKKQYLCAIKQQLTDRVKTGRVTYGNSVISYANASEALLKMPTPPCKLIDNHKVINLNFVYGVTAWPIRQPSV